MADSTARDFIARTTLWKHRMRLPGFELPDNVLEAHRDFDEEMAKSLDSVADRMEGKAANTSTSALDDSLEKLEHVGRTLVDGTQDDREAQLITLLLLSRKTEQLAVSLNIECEDHQAALLALSPPVAS
jgi:multidrug resistance protein MdtO